MDPLLHESRPLRHQALIPDLDLVQGDYRVRFARTEADLDAVCRLRFEVFNLELGEGLSESFRDQRDRDLFDEQCQHLMVIEEASGQTVGTYRLQVSECALAGAGFYSATEFDLSTMPQEVLDDAVELGRACVGRDHRSRSVLFLLWKGLASYILWNQRSWFFGCNSLTSQDPVTGMRTWSWLQQNGHAHERIRIAPHAEYACDADELDDSLDGVEIPTLFGIYLRYGSKVCGPPALDRSFGTVDFLTVLDVRTVDPRIFQGYAR